MKKRLLKINCSRKVKMLSAGIVSLIMIGVLNVNVFANNHYDQSFWMYNVGEYGQATSTEAKTDDSSAYIQLDGDVNAYVEVCSCGIDYTQNPGGYYVQKGTWRYLYNLVYENGQRTCYLYLKPASKGRHNLHGLWSPDSI